MIESLSLTALRAQLDKRKVSSKELVKHFVSRIKQHDQSINSIITLNEGAAARAKELDRLLEAGRPVGALHGIPILVKDNYCTRGLRTTAGSKMLKNFIPPYSATVVERLEQAGAVVIGKTNMDEFGMGSSNENSHFGACRNPFNQEYVSGGSSGGSAAAVAARFAPLALGTDTGGSIRLPAHYCGVFGLKPTYGRVSRYGIVAFASSLDQAGPLARTTEDLALCLEAISGPDPYDSTCSSVGVPPYAKNITGSVKGLKVGLPREYFSDEVDAETRATLDSVIKALKSGGAEIVDISLPLSEHAVAVYYMIATSEASSNLARYDGVRFGHRADFTERPAQDLADFYARNRTEGFGDEVKRRILLGTFALSSGYYDAYYNKASQVRRLMQQDFLKAFESVDVLLSPVSTGPAFKIGEKTADPIKMYLNDIFTTSTNLAGLPGMSVPAGHTSAGLPLGVQLTATHFDEATLFNCSKFIENTFDAAQRIPHGL